MTERFELYRFSLLEKKQMDLEGEEFKDFTREEWLKKVFAEEYKFNHHGQAFHYVPKFDNNEKNVVIGRIGKHIKREENKSPEEGFIEFTREAWIAALLIIDPTNHKDGQQLAFQYIKEVGKTIHLIENLVESINHQFIYGPYFIEVGLIIEKQSFWDFVKENKGNITNLSFELTTPNMPWGASDQIDRDLKDWQKHEHARRMTLSLSNSDGEIIAETKKVEEMVNYAARTGGIIKGRAKGKKIFNSSDAGKLSNIKGLSGTVDEMIKIVCEQSKKLFRRE